MASISSLSFYTLTNTDGVATASILHRAKLGHFELSSARPNAEEPYKAPIETWLYIPNEHLSDMAFGVKAVCGDDTYIVQVCEEFDDHQEVTMRKVQ